MASLSDFLSAPSGSALPGVGGNPGWTTPQYRLNETAPALQADASIATTRSLQNYADRALPDMNNQAAGLGNFGSSGANNRADRLQQDTGRNVFDIQRMLGRSLANISQQRVMATYGGMF